MPRGDAIRALDHLYRQRILRALARERATYSDLFSHLEPDGGERARFNYHLRSLRNADLVRLTDSIYSLTPRGEAALVLLREVSGRSDTRPRPKRESRAGERGWVQRVGDALRSRTAGVKAMVPVGRVLLLVGSVLLLVSLFLPWFTVSYAVSGSEVEWRVSSHDLFPGTFRGLEAMVGFGWFGGGVYAFAAFVWLILVAVIGVTSALVVRKFAWFGASGIAVLALSAITMFLVAEQLGRMTPSVGFELGFTLALIGSALIETGARLKTSARVALMGTPLPLGILLIGFGVVSAVGGFFALPPGPHGLSSPIPGILLMGLGIASTVGGLFALKSATKAPPSPGVLLMVLGTVSAVGGFLAFLYGGWANFDLVTVTMIFGVTTLVVGTVLRVRQSIASGPARPAVSLSGEAGSGRGGRRQRQRRHRFSRRRASVQFPPVP